VAGLRIAHCLNVAVGTVEDADDAVVGDRWPSFNPQSRYLEFIVFES